MRIAAAVLASTLVLAALPLHANDPWEADPENGGPATRGYIVPGQSQTGRDLQANGTPDQDWVWFSPLPHHSYEARALGGTLWATDFTDGARLERVDSSLLVQGFGSDEGLGSLRGHFLRWIAPGNDQVLNYLRVTGTASESASPYVLELFDTTYALPRWNNSATQFTILIVQNHTPQQVIAVGFFYDADGVLLAQQGLVMPANGMVVLNTSTIPALAGRNGSARIAQAGGRGAISGKAVALEPQTGFTFDTPLTPLIP